MIDEAMKMADQVITYRTVVKQVAAANGMYATFMPKPIAGINGSGMHVHQSLFANGSNAFFDAKDPLYLSQTARHYIAGILANVKEICSVTNQWVNSYKRLVPGYEAPAYIAWGRKNRSALVRIPQAKAGKPAATRIECRFPDPACNPYLAFAIMLGAGLDGIKRKLPVPAITEENIFHMTPEERQKRGIDTLPAYLYEAINYTRHSELVRKVLGNHTFEKFIANKDIPQDTPPFQDIDASLTARDIAELMRRKGINPLHMPKTRERQPLEVYSGAGTIFGCSGGVMEAALRTAYFALSGEELKNVDIEVVRGHDNAIVEATIPVPIKALGGKKFDVRVCVVNGANQGLKEVLRRIQVDKNRYHFIEVMNCPGGCVNGGGQPVQSAGTAWLHPTMPLPLRV